MAKPGPKPLPSNIRQYTGGQKKDTTDEPTLEIKASPPPDYFDSTQRACWSRNAEKLARMQVMTDADRDLLEMYVITWLRWRDAVKKTGTEYTVESPKSGYPIQNPLLSVANKAEAQLIKIMAEFGFSPSSRTRVRMDR